MLELVSDRLLIAREHLVAGIADVEADRNLAVRIGLHGPDPRQEGRIPAGGIVGVVGQDRQRGVGGRPPGEGGRESVAPVLDVIDLRLRIPRQTGQPVEPLAFGVDRSAEIECPLLQVPGATGDFDLAERRRGRALVDGRKSVNTPGV
jgi:hypothetical protein